MTVAMLILIFVVPTEHPLLVATAATLLERSGATLAAATASGDYYCGGLEVVLCSAVSASSVWGVRELLRAGADGRSALQVAKDRATRISPVKKVRNEETSSAGAQKMRRCARCE